MTLRVPLIQFRREPARITLLEGLELALRHQMATARIWLVPVAIVAVLSTAVFAATDSWTSQSNPSTYGDVTYDVAAYMARLLPALVVRLVLVGTIASVAQCVYYALAIAGLRGMSISARWVADRGVRIVAVNLVLGAVGTAFSLLSQYALNAPFLFVFLAIFFLPCLWLMARLVFWTYAVVDGDGIVDGFWTSFEVSEDAIGRIVGWYTALVAISVLASGITLAVLTPAIGLAPLLSGLIVGVSEAVTVFIVFALAVLYEIQRRLGSPDLGAAPLPVHVTWGPPDPGP